MAESSPPESYQNEELSPSLDIDRGYLVDTLSRLARVPTDIPLGYETFMDPDDPKLVHYVQDVLRPELVRLGYYDLIDAPRNNLIARVGSGTSGQSLLIMNYTPAQHHNLMVDPFSGKIANAQEFGADEPAIFGQGVSQNKAHQAVMLAVLKALRDSKSQLRGRLYWAINNEGRSSHACSNAILDALGATPDFGIIQIGTGLRVSLGNRGRADVLVHVRGKAVHSSEPGLGLSAIDGANEVINCLRNLTWPDSHPILGGRHAVVYKVRYEPLAPHTLPSDAYLSIDRRLLPGDNPFQAADEIREIIGDLRPFEVTVTPDVYMLPAMVNPRGAGVRQLLAAHIIVAGEPPECIYGQGTFDAGGPCARGVPTVMYGASGGVGLLGPDFVPISAVHTEAQVLAQMISDVLS